MNKQKHSSYVSLKLENTWNVRLERSAQLSFVVWNEPRSWLEERWTSFVRFVVCQDTQIRAKHDKAVWTCWVFFFPSRTFTRSCFEPYLWATLFSRWCDAVQCVTDYFPITALSQKYFIPLTNTEFQLLVPLDAILSSIWTKSEFPHRVWWLKCFHNFWVQARVQS